MSEKIEYTSASEIRNLRNLHIPMSLERIFKYEETLSEKLMDDDLCYFYPESQKEADYLKRHFIKSRFIVEHPNRTLSEPDTKVLIVTLPKSDLHFLFWRFKRLWKFNLPKIDFSMLGQTFLLIFTIVLCLFILSPIILNISLGAILQMKQSFILFNGAL